MTLTNFLLLLTITFLRIIRNNRMTTRVDSWIVLKVLTPIRIKGCMKDWIQLWINKLAAFHNLGAWIIRIKMRRENQLKTFMGVITRRRDISCFMPRRMTTKKSRSLNLIQRKCLQWLSKLTLTGTDTQVFRISIMQKHHHLDVYK